MNAHDISSEPSVEDGRGSGARRGWFVALGCVAVLLVALAVACGSRPSSSPTAPTSAITTSLVPGVSASIPPAWNIQPSSGTSSAVVSNVSTLSSMDDPAAAQESAFHLRVMAGSNSANLSLDNWFESQFPNGFDGPIWSRSNITVDGRPALAVEVSASGRRRLVFIADGSNIVEVSYPLTNQTFIGHYEAILNSLRLAR